MARKRSKRQKPDFVICRTCEHFFQPYRNYQKYCSGPCRNKFWRTKNRSIRFATESLDTHSVKIAALERRVKALESRP